MFFRFLMDSMPEVDVRRVIDQQIAEGIKESIRKALEEGKVKVEEVAKKWAVRYCEFAGFTPEEAEKIVEAGELAEKCGARVAEAYLKYV